jgi:methionine-S-sulfoxide reductase
MKTIALLVALGSALALSLSALAGRGGADSDFVKVTNSGIGVTPGDIGKRMDILQAARERGHDLAMFAGGCFWGTEGQLRLIKKGIVATAVGYSGGHVPNPTYEMVCGHTTGHAESVLVEFDPKQISYEQLVNDFFQMHDPTQVDGQGPDLGNNYRSAIFFFDNDQEAIARKVKEELQATKYKNERIATEITKAGPFWMAEDYHQQYYEKRGMAPACNIH